nr:MAG TPA: hypothetical protein [Caudoviricetes sp.]
MRHRKNSRRERCFNLFLIHNNLLLLLLFYSVFIYISIKFYI